MRIRLLYFLILFILCTGEGGTPSKKLSLPQKSQFKIACQFLTRDGQAELFFQLIDQALPKYAACRFCTQLLKNAAGFCKPPRPKKGEQPTPIPPHSLPSTELLDLLSGMFIQFHEGESGTPLDRGQVTLALLDALSSESVKGRNLTATEKEYFSTLREYIRAAVLEEVTVAEKAPPPTPTPPSLDELFK